MFRGTAVRRALAALLAVVTAAAGVVVLATAPADASIVRPFTLNYDQEIYGDFLQAGNGNSRCPTLSDPQDPFGEIPADCVASQARTYTAQSGFNDSFYMRWADVDGLSATYNSSTAAITIPSGATVDFARLNWSGDTGNFRDDDGFISSEYGCNSRQLLAGAGFANAPAGTPESQSVRLTVGGATPVNVAPAVITRDAMSSVPATQAQFYSAYANVTAQLAAATTGVSQTITVGNIWTPEGFGCYAGWSLVVVYKYASPNTNAPAKREVFVYDGHVRQSSTDATTTTTINGFRVGAAGTRVGLTAFEGDFSITGDQFLINGTAVVEPLSGSNTTNFFVSNAQRDVNPAPLNNMSVDSKEFTTSLIPVGATSANLAFSTSGDTYLAANLVLSVPVPSLNITKTLVGTGPFRPGQTVTYQITVVSPGGSNAVNVAIGDPAVTNCNRTIGNLAADVPFTYTCSGPAPADDFTQTATATGQNAFGDTMTDSDSVNVVVISPSIDITKTANAASYTTGQTITFTITVANTGDTALTGVVVSDVVSPSCARAIGTLAIGGTTTYTCTATAPVLGDANTAVVTATDPLLATVTDSATVQVPTVGTVSGRVFADRNNNGAFETGNGDTGIQNVTVTLVGTTAAGAAVNLTTTSAANGTYSFAGIAAGVYTITETQPTAFDDGIDTPGTNAIILVNDRFTVTLPSGASSVNNNFAEQNTSSLSGSVYIDANNNGVRNVGELGIALATVALTGTDTAGNAVSLTTTTALDGSYTFGALRPGTYAVAETQPAGFSDGADAVGSAGGTLTPPDSITAIALPVRTNATGYTFGEFVGASLAGTVVDDAGNPIPGVVITLTRPVGGTSTTTTSATGDYSFTGLPPGTYSLSEAQPAGYGDGPETAGTAGGSTAVNDVISGITLASGAAATGYVFAEDRGSLSGRVYEDLNNNGVFNVGEPGIAGAAVSLAGTDAGGNAVNLSLVSAADGTYTFTGLRGGTYAVSEVTPAGYNDAAETVGSSGGTLTPPNSITAITLGGGVDATGYNFGELRAASISGTVRDDTGAGIGGVTITLTGPSGPQVATTAANGTYTFTNLLPGSYTLTETQPVGFADGPETVGSAGGSAVVNDTISGIPITSGTTATGYIFAEDRGSLSGTVYQDTNNNGVQNPGEPGLGGVTVTLTGTDAANVAVNRTTTTAADGTYTFAGLRGGTYTVTESQPAGYTDGTDTIGSAGGTLTPPDSVTAITLGAGVDATGYNFGEFQSTSIAGRVVNDLGGGIGGVTITLNGPGGTRTTTTAANGNYSFPNLAPGTYSLAETQPVGYADGPDTAGTAGGTVANDVISGITLASGTAATGYVFAEDRGSLAGEVYEDSNDNGARDPGEAPIPGTLITLTGTDATGAAVSRTTTAAADGSYIFTGVLSGTYALAETQPTGYSDGKDTVGSAGGTLTPPDSITAIALDPGQDGTGYLFGDFIVNSITGQVVNDAAEGIPGVTITLTRPGGGTSTTTTGADGRYVFANLTPGSYNIAETQPIGYADGPDTVGDAGGTITANDVISGIILVSGESASGYDFAEDRGSLSGVVYRDLNNNGLQDPGETGIGGVAVALTGTDDANGAVNRTTTTAADGTYTFAGLLGGIYTVTETQPAGFLDGKDTAGTSGGTLTPPDSISAIDVNPGVDATNYRFGEVTGASLAGRVVDDAANGIPGATITLTGTDDNNAPVSLTTTTGPTGTYSFTGLRPGTYTVTETQPAGYGDGPDTAGSAGGTVGNDVISGIVLGSGTTATGYQFAEDRGSLSGVVYVDTNNNGLQDPGEVGISGATVTLTGTDALNNPVSVVTTSAANGTYSFTNLVGGTYSVTETQPAGYTDGADRAGTSGGTPTPPDTIASISLAGGVDATGYLFGEFVAGSIAGRVVDDGGTGIAGVSVTLTGPGGPITAISAADGSYSFPSLVPGTYTLTETQPNGYGDGPETAGTAGGNTAVNDVISGIVVGSGVAATGYVFAEDRGSLAGVVFEDRNNNGTQDPAEPGIGGVAVALTGQDVTGAAVTRNVTTAANGTYTFTNLIGGTYAITETQPAGYTDGADRAGTSGGTLTPPDSITAVTLAGGVDATGYTFGEFRGSSLAGRVVDDGGNGIAGVTVVLTGPGGPINALSAPDGTYSFPNLTPGTYTVTETQPAGYGDGPDTAGTAGGTVANDVISGIVIASGTTATGYVFAEDRGSIAGVVFDDFNNNGLQDPGELGIGGVAVSLSGTDAQNNPVNTVVVTAGNGSYSFVGLVGGTYTVTESQPATYSDGTDTPGTSGGTLVPPDTITAIALGGGVDATGYTFAEYRGATISGRVVNDDNLGIPGVTVTLTDDNGNQIGSPAITDNSGAFAFAGLAPGTYTITETQPAGYGDGPDTAGTAGGVVTNDQISGIAVLSGTQATGYTFSEEHGSLAGVVFEDLNNNGVRDPSDPGIPGVLVSLAGTDAQGVPVNREAITAANGGYVFDHLLGGTYEVTESQPVGYADGAETIGTSGGVLVPPNSVTAIEVEGGFDATGYNFGEFRSSSLSGRVVDDAGNGIPNVTVTLTGPGGPVPVTTAADGSYSFPDLPPGTYTITEAQPAGYADGPDTVGSAGGNGSVNDVFSNIVIGSGANGTGYVFAEDRGSLAGVVFEDTNGNGTQDPGEQGIAGVTVMLSGTDDQGNPVSTTVLTGANGGYLFDGLVGGDYSVIETQPAGYVDGIDTAGSSGGTLTPPDTVAAIILDPGVNATSYTFAEFRASGLSGRVVDDGGNGIPGVTITLTGPGVPITVTTGPDGSYSFPNLPPGTYSITETQPAGYGDGPDTAGTAGGTVGPDTFTGIVVGSGTTGTGYQFAEDRGSLAGVVFDDTNNNGVQDSGEPGIGGVSVTLSGTDAQTNPVNTVVTTAPNGAYSFANLVGGTYTITETQPAGYVDGIDTVGTAGGTLVPPDAIAVVLGGGVDGTGYTFGEFRASGLSGRVVDDGGNGIPGVTITLTGPGAPITVITGPDGSYSFPNLPPGTYTITETQPAGYGDGPDTPGGAGGDASVNDVISGIVVGSGTDGTGYEFAEDRGSLVGVVFDDTNNNGTQDPGEPGIGGVSVTLTGTDAQGTPVNTTVTSGPNGAYTFPNLVGGTYTVTEAQPAGYADGVDTPGTSGGTATPPDSITAIALGGGVDATGYTFAEYRTSGLSGQVVDDGGNGIPGVTITLTGPGAPITVTTGPDGSYLFPNLPPGTYTIAETQPAGYGDGPDTAGTAGGTVGPDVFTGIVIGSGTTGTGYEFAENRGSLAGVVFDDTNGNGSQDPGEAGIGGVSVTLLGTDAQGNAVNTTVLSGPTGDYTFSDLVGGTYAVTETQPNGYVDGIDTPGSSGGTLTPPDSITAITLDGGADATGYTFGEYRAGGLSGRVVDDGGNGIPGVTIVLTGPGAPITITTGPDGSYSFPNLPPGTYTITETQPAGYGDGPDTAGTAGGDVANDVFSNIVVVSGTDGTGYQFAEDRGSLAGVVFEDTNGNGTQDPGEPGIGGVSVTLSGTDAQGAPVNTVVTSAPNGSYSFAGLVGGTYSVTEAQPAGYADGIDTAGNSGGTLTPPDSITAITLGAGVDATGYTFGEYRASGLSGRVVDDGGNGIANVLVVLTGPGGPISALTGPDGTYSFPNLLPGTYTITETQPAGYGDGPDTAGSAGGTAGNDVFSNIVVNSGTDGTGYQFAEDRGSLAGVVFDDTNNNGTQDPGEPGIGGVSVTLSGTDAQGNAVNTTVTSAPNGAYTFPNLVGGVYTVTETQPAGYVDGTDTAGSAGGTVTPPDSITAIDLDGGVDATGYTFAEYRASGLSGRVVDDGGNGIPGVTITLTGPGAPITVTTGPDGTYSFPNLPPGTYTITETQPAGYGDGPDTPGSAGGTPGNDVFSNIVVGSGTDGTGYQFAEDRGSLAGVVFDDTNNNGTQDVGEPGIGGVSVTLSGADVTGAPVNVTVTSAPNGSYSFPNLVGGTYSITETQPAGYVDGIDTAGSVGGTPVPPDSITAITLGGGADGTGYTFGEYRASVLSGRVVDDGGNGIPGVTLVLTGPGGPITITTGPDGSYSFPNLPPGTYTITETQPAGYGDGPDTPGGAGGDASVNDVISGIVIGSGTTGTGYEFAEDRGSLTGAVFQDLDNDGTRDAGEPGIPGATVTLTGTDATGAPVTRVVTTAADGGYAFTDLIGGVYTITETQPAGFLDGTDAAGTAGGTVTPPDSVTAITLDGGVDGAGYTFGELPGSSLSGRVVDDGGNPIGGVTLVLTGTDDNGNPVSVTVTTNPDGTYTFPGLRPGTYTITETQPAGYGDGPDTPGSAGGNATVNDVISGIVITPGTTGTDYGFAETRGSLAGVVFDDTNNNGTQDPGEPGIGGVTVTLSGTDAQGNTVNTVVTSAANGTYTFSNLVGGTYTITETQPAGYVDGIDAAGTAGGTLTPPDSVTAIALGGGVAATGYTFGEFRGGTVSGRVVDDGGNGIPGVTVTLTGPGGPVTVTTGPDGSYSFPNLTPGTYTVTETQPAGYGDGPDEAGDPPGIAGNDVISEIPVTSGSSGGGYNFTETRGSLAGVVFQDLDGDGTQDIGEPGIAGVTVNLAGTDALGRPVTATVTSAANGSYTFADLVGGTYTVTEVQPAGYADGADTAGSAGGTVTPPDSITAIALGAGAEATGYTFAELTGAITGTVFIDLDGDGVIDPVEPGRLAGVTVILRDGAGNQLATTVTDANGAYVFIGRPAGNYIVEELQPDGYGSTTPNSVPVTLNSSEGANVNFGEQLGSIGDLVFEDANFNGVQDPGELGVGGVVVILYDADGVEITRTTTDTNGGYRFTGLAAGTYVIGLEVPDGAALTKPGQGTDRAVDSDVDWLTGLSGPVVITLTGGRISQRTDVDAGLVDRVVDLGITLTVDKPQATIGDTVVFTETVTNTGTVPVKGATTTITVPTGLAIGTATGEGWECTTAGQVLTCTTDTLTLPGESLPPITVTTHATQQVPTTEVVATVSPVDGTPDDNPDNDRAVVTVTVTPIPAPPRPVPPAPRPPLAWTGSNLQPLLLGGLLLLMLGGGFLLIGRKRRRSGNTD
ncbi:SdrD B-like domain-containing protein [Actinokineospora sp. NBRC 105648]|uniref:SdrD B-like domain-containing protein n=1 Tax=Actinokineospora sp. NBRC 105648 TaxID=3032206 RepID=UPI0024A3580C|nr:SdrD B-like domain-containing protein [Actinokineospora sp. NBRC 105648]GLZ42916.1 hypothetical protein Acsp05_65400 [Actinokineospora sp. NBRC 105648]